MNSAVRLSLIGFLIVFLLGLGAWWYLFGPNMVSAAELVPADTIAFATIPNGTKIATEYRGSNLKTLADSPGAQPFISLLQESAGPKNVELLNDLLPCLSGQSFIAITHFDPRQPSQIGMIAAMHPKMGLNRFQDFVEKVKTGYANELKLTTIGSGQVEGIDYQSLQATGSPQKLCIAHVGGWIVTTWGEAPLGDFIQRLHKKAATPNLAQRPEYQKSISRAGDGAEAFLYLDVAACAPATAAMPWKNEQGTYLASKLSGTSIAAMGAQFQNGEIMDRFSLLRSAQSPGPAAPCAFDTLKFTGTDTRFYWASSVDWKTAWQAVQAGASPETSMPNFFLHFLQTWTQGEGLDMDRNVIGALGSELCVQAEWSADDSYPEIGLFVKVDKQDDFKPTIDALLDTVRRTYANLAVVDEISSGDHHFATLKFVQPLPFNPTITENGPYFGLFLSGNQAVRSFARDETTGLLHNNDFLRQIGDKRQGASQLVFLDSPTAFNHAYSTLAPYLSFAAMFSPPAAAWIKNHPLPADLGWLAPIDTWSFVLTPDAEGYQGYSVSGIGNQGIYLATAINSLNAFPMIGNQVRHFLPTITPVPLPPAPSPAPPVVSAPTNSPAAAAPAPIPDATNIPATTAPPDASKGP